MGFCEQITIPLGHINFDEGNIFSIKKAVSFLFLLATCVRSNHQLLQIWALAIFITKTNQSKTRFKKYAILIMSDSQYCSYEK